MSVDISDQEASLEVAFHGSVSVFLNNSSYIPR